MARSQDIVNSITTTTAPSTLKKLFEYDVSNLVIYAGSAPRGASENEDIWVITQYTYDGNQNCTSELTALDAWSNRATANYA